MLTEILHLGQQLNVAVTYTGTETGSHFFQFQTEVVKKDSARASNCRQQEHVLQSEHPASQSSDYFAMAGDLQP